MILCIPMEENWKWEMAGEEEEQGPKEAQNTLIWRIDCRTGRAGADLRERQARRPRGWSSEGRVVVKECLCKCSVRTMQKVPALRESCRQGSNVL